MNEQGAVGLFDSGFGGLSVWREVARLLPHEDIIYVADQAHVPYGSRSLDEVREFSEQIVRFLLGEGVKVIVIACNAASAAALYYVRNRFPGVPFVGMEPAIKPAVERTRTGIVGVIATRTTFQGKLFASLMARYARGVHVLTQVGTGLVEAVESGNLDEPETEALVRECVVPLVEAGADQLVLGCTHYPFLRPLIERVVGEKAEVIDPAPAVARQTERVLTRMRLAADPDRQGEHLFYTSGNVFAFTEMFRRVLPDDDLGEVRPVFWRDGRLERLE